MPIVISESIVEKYLFFLSIPPMNGFISRFETQQKAQLYVDQLIILIVSVFLVITITLEN